MPLSCYHPKMVVIVFGLIIHMETMLWPSPSALQEIPQNVASIPRHSAQWRLQQARVRCPGPDESDPWDDRWQRCEHHAGGACEWAVSGDCLFPVRGWGALHVAQGQRPPKLDRACEWWLLRFEKWVYLVLPRIVCKYPAYQAKLKRVGYMQLSIQRSWVPLG